MIDASKNKQTRRGDGGYQSIHRFAHAKPALDGDQPIVLHGFPPILRKSKETLFYGEHIIFPVIPPSSLLRRKPKQKNSLFPSKERYVTIRPARAHSSVVRAGCS